MFGLIAMLNGDSSSRRSPSEETKTFSGDYSGDFKALDDPFHGLTGLESGDRVRAVYRSGKHAKAFAYGTVSDCNGCVKDAHLLFDATNFPYESMVARDLVGTNYSGYDFYCLEKCE